MDDARIYDVKITGSFCLCCHLSLLHKKDVNDRKRAFKMPRINMYYKSKITKTDFYTFVTSCEQFQTD